MAIAIGSYVALKRADPERFGGVPTFGIIYSGADPWGVLWDTGEANTVPGSVLDEIAFLGPDPKIYRYLTDAGVESPLRDGAAVTNFARVGVEQGFLLRLINVALAVEVAPADLEELPDR